MIHSPMEVVLNELMTVENGITPTKYEDEAWLLSDVVRSSLFDKCTQISLLQILKARLQFFSTEFLELKIPTSAAKYDIPPYIERRRNKISHVSRAGVHSLNDLFKFETNVIWKV